MTNSQTHDRMVEANGLTFRSRIDGREGAPWLVFSNSLMTDLTMWDGQVAAFADRFRILRYDQRGHGGTQVPAGEGSFDLLIEDVVALFDAFAIERASFVGLSMGAATAIGLAGRHPGRVEKVVIADGQSFTPPGGAEAWEERIEAARRSGMAGLAEPTVRRWFRPETVEAGRMDLDKVRAMIARTPFDGFLACARALQNFDLRDELSRLRAPALFLVGDSDGVLPQTMREMAAKVPGSQFVEIEGAGHLPNIEQPGRFNAALKTFLAPA